MNTYVGIEMTKTNKRSKSPEKGTPEYLSVEAIDSLLKEGADPIAMMSEMKKLILQRAMEAELDQHLTHTKYQKSSDGNYRNGHGRKTVIMDNGSVEINTPRDRDGTFEPQLIGKRQRQLKGFDRQILSMYGRGMSTRDIQSHFEEMYGTEVSHEFISNVTDAVLEEVKGWQHRPLNPVYPIVYLDAMVIKVRHNGHIINKSLYIAMGVDMEGKKDILGLWLAENEGAKFWLSVLNELKNRGVEDILIACCDGLSGFPEAINTAFPKTDVQLCIVHMVRNSLKFVSFKDYKEVTAGLKLIYKAVEEKEAMNALEKFATKWDSKYPMIADSWRRHWEGVIPFMKYPPDIRKALYTTNVIEASNRQIRKVIKTKGSFTSDESVYKIVYLALQNAQKKWTMPIRDWPVALNQFCIFFPGRCKV